MKKELTILSLALAPALGVAAPMTTSGSIRTTDCTLLQDNVAVTLSNGVQAGWNCNTTATVQSIGLAMCHLNGRTASRSAQVVTCDNNVDPVTCSSSTSTTTGAVFPAATTRGGNMQMIFPGSACTAANADTQAGAVTQ